MSTSLVKINESLANAESILQDNTAKKQRALEAGEQMMAKLNEVNEINYKQGLEYLGKVKKTVDVMNENRKPITQMLTEISKQFTVLEAALDVKGSETIPSRIQKRLDAYATEKAKEQLAKEMQLKRMQQVKYALIESKANYEKEVNTRFTKIVTRELERIEKMYATATFENFAEVTAMITNLRAPILVESDFSGLNDSKINIIDDADFEAMKVDVLRNVLDKYNSILNDHFTAALTAVIADFDQRYQNLEIIHQEKDERAKTELEKDIELENLIRKSDSISKATELKTILDKSTEFEKILEETEQQFVSAGEVEKTDVKVQYKIEVTNPIGWFDLMAFWYEMEAKTMTNEQIEKKLGFLITFAEKQKNKTEVSIKSDGLNYYPIAKAK